MTSYGGLKVPNLLLIWYVVVVYYMSNMKVHLGIEMNFFVILGLGCKWQWSRLLHLMNLNPNPKCRKGKENIGSCTAQNQNLNCSPSV